MNAATKTYQTRLAGIRRSTAAAVTGAWDRLDNYDKPGTAAFAARVAPTVASGQLLAARLTAAYVARQTGVRMPAMTKANVTGEAARNVDPIEEYQRPFGLVWSTLAKGTPYTEALEMGRTRLGLLVATDVWLATRTANEVIDKATPQITRWVRVADAGACAECSAADGQELASAADFAGHPGCGCSVEARTDGDPVSEAANPESIAVEPNDELGPVLVPAA